MHTPERSESSSLVNIILYYVSGLHYIRVYMCMYKCLIIFVSGNKSLIYSIFATRIWQKVTILTIVFTYC